LVLCRTLGKGQDAIVKNRTSTAENSSSHLPSSTPESTPQISDPSQGPAVKPEPPTDALKVLGVLKCQKITDRVINAVKGIFQYHVKRKLKNIYCLLELNLLLS